MLIEAKNSNGYVTCEIIRYTFAVLFMMFAVVLDCLFAVLFVLAVTFVSSCLL